MKRYAFAALILSCSLAMAQAPASPSKRLRGSVQQFDGNSLVIAERNGQVIQTTLADNFSVSEILPIELSAIQPGSFIGAAGMPQPDGTIKALQVTVFPESSRGTGEGHRPWDAPGSTMTNATVVDMVSAVDGRTLKLKYKDGEKTLVVPPGTPIVTFKPADRSLLVPGAKVMVMAQSRDGKTMAIRALAGKNGYEPPM